MKKQGVSYLRIAQIMNVKIEEVTKSSEESKYPLIRIKPSKLKF